ncbi:Bax inhibitor-1/YccA family protein [Alkalibacillus haloalkaliphilus]|uniref:Membrane protein n=1 Tax=Alkalibacillus haloalkaliphilus TaxID=94136 RepID=A0A511W3H3_9BACI|nr:Bax inhibitor-1/YccA family protein [Alkalibacillus haloalkaliphilus]GEN45497.1 membrane protein [Alkalibacillus haloalkaliphilus]
MRVGNPTLQDKTFSNNQARFSDEVMTINGTVQKTLILALLLLITATYSWHQYQQDSQTLGGFIMIAVIAALGVAILTAIVPRFSPVTAPIYVLLKGLSLGFISAHYEAMYDGIVFQAAFLTIMTLLAMLIVYRLGIIRVTDKFRLGVFAATGAIFLAYIISFIGRFVGFQVPHLHDATPLGIVISVVIVIVAALNLVIDFDFIERKANQQAAKYMEWYGAFGLMVTIIWLYLEILRLLAKIKARK